MSGASASLDEKLVHYAQTVDAYCKSFFINYESTVPGLKILAESVKYSAMTGGKRFRPVLSLMTAEALGVRPQKILPYGTAVEFVHTYSLIHDDLPCMDDDDFRRGQPTNHKKFGEATALLAGDALLTEAFYLISSSYAETPDRALQAILELSRAAGPRGMVGGQAMDMHSKKNEQSLDHLIKMHAMKTGALIRAAVVGAAHLSGADPAQVGQLAEYSEQLGLAFQIADDILDHDPNQVEAGSFPAVLGIDETRAHLARVSDAALAPLSKWGAPAEPLRQMITYNVHRLK